MEPVLQTRSLYFERIRLVQVYIDTHLDQPLDMETLARVAGFSPYHFHRVFHAFAGETPAEAVRNRRLAAAAGHLRYRQRETVEQVAIACGFSSLSDFSRAFRRAYGVSPTAWRRNRQTMGSGGLFKLVSLQEDPKPMDTHVPRTGESSLEALLRDVRIIRISDEYAAFLRCHGLSPDWETQAVKDAWKRLIAWGAARDLIGPDTRFIGLTLDHPELMPFSECRYDACITVPAGTAPDGEIGVRTLKIGGKYAMLSFRQGDPGFPEKLYEAMDGLFGQWLPDNGYEPDYKPFLEMWGAGTSPGEVSLSFCIPIKPYGT